MQDPQDVRGKSIPPGPKPSLITIQGVDARIHVTVQHDLKRPDHTFQHPSSGQLAQVYVVKAEFKDGDVLPLSPDHLELLKAKLEASKQDGSKSKEVELEFLTTDPKWPDDLNHGERRGVILRVPFGLDSATSKEEWEANAVMIQKS